MRIYCMRTACPAGDLKTQLISSEDVGHKIAAEEKRMSAMLVMNNKELLIELYCTQKCLRRNNCNVCIVVIN
jgi:hypothetical protein